MNRVRSWCLAMASIAALAVVAACNGGSGVAPSLQNGYAATKRSDSQAIVDAKQKRRGWAHIEIRIPRKKKPGRHMRPLYISPSTKSMTVADLGQATQTFNLTPSSSGCSTSQTSGTLTCTETAFFPPGQQTLTVALYDQQNGEGNQLAAAMTTVSIVAGAVTSIPITLDGVVATATVLLNGAATDDIPSGTATSIPVTVNGYDADKNLILSPGNYSSPITLTNSDGSGVTTLSATSVSAPGATVSLSYSGGSLSSTTITPSVNSVAQAGAATLTISTSSPPESLLYVNTTGDPALHGSGMNVVVYPLDGSSPTQSGAITSSVTQPAGIAVDLTGNLWVADTSSGTVVEYQHGSGYFGSTGTTVLSGLGDPTALKFDSQGNLYVAYANPQQPSESSNISEYASNGNGISTTPSRTVAIGGAGSIDDLAVDSSGNIWFSVGRFDSAGGSVQIIMPGATEPTAPTLTYLEGQPALSNPTGIAISADGETLVVADAQGLAIDLFNIQSSGVAAETATFSFPNTSRTFPAFVAFDSSENLYVSATTGSQGCFAEFAANQTTAAWSTCGLSKTIWTIAVANSVSPSSAIRRARALRTPNMPSVRQPAR